MTLLLTRHARLVSAHLSRHVAPRFARLALCAALTLAVAAAVAPTPLLHAQSAATLTGTVFDPHGVALANATVTVRNEATKAVQKQSSDAQGKYLFANLPAGKYTVQVEASGFAPSKLTEIQFAADQSVELPITMAMLNVYDQVTDSQRG